MAASEETKLCRRKLWLYRILDWICLFMPVIIYIVIAMCEDGVTRIGKVGVVGCVAISVILTLFNVISQKRLRCPIWIILLGLFLAIRELLLPLIIILAVTSILDDLVFTPIISYYSKKLVANKVYDERSK